MFPPTPVLKVPVPFSAKKTVNGAANAWACKQRSVAHQSNKKNL
jgi:hypothetical protein